MHPSAHNSRFNGNNAGDGGDSGETLNLAVWFHLCMFYEPRPRRRHFCLCEWFFKINGRAEQLMGWTEHSWSEPERGSGFKVRIERLDLGMEIAGSTTTPPCWKRYGSRLGARASQRVMWNWFYETHTRSSIEMRWRCTGGRHRDWFREPADQCNDAHFALETSQKGGRPPVNGHCSALTGDDDSWISFNMRNSPRWQNEIEVWCRRRD